MTLAKRQAALLALIGLTTCLSRGAALENVAPQRGHPAASISWTDESGQVRKLSEFAGYPVVLLPIYTRCRSACRQNVAQLKQALGMARADPKEFRVLLFSFDSSDTPAVLTAYRERESIPLPWLTGSADQANVDALLESIGFQYGKAGAEFTHPNMVIFLDPNLRVAKWIYGTGYSGREVDAALKVALGRSDWIGRHTDVVYAILLFGAALLCVALFEQILRRSSIRSGRTRLALQK